MNKIEQTLRSLNIYTLQEASKILKVKPDTLLKRIKNGKAVGYKVGQTWLIIVNKE